MSGFSLRYFSPPAALREWISIYYMLESDLLVWNDTLRAELPQVRFKWMGSTVISVAGLPEIKMPRASIYGPSYGAIRFRTRGPIRMFGAGLRPAGWAALIGTAAKELADLPHDLELLAGAPARRTLEHMAEAGSDRERIEAINTFFLSLAARAQAAPLWFTRATDAWLAGSPNPDVNTLVQTLGMSARQVERLSLRVYGAAPKLMARKSRTVQAAIRLGRNPAAGWTEASAGAFYDQSHFIRDFKTFIGMTPGEYLERGTSSLIRITVSEP